MKRTNIEINDNQSAHLRDKFAGHNSFTSVPNRVVVTKKDRGVDKEPVKLVDTTNLIVYHGRHWLMQRAFNQDISTVGGVQDQDGNITNRVGYRNKYISWFGVGCGANRMSASPLDVDHPALSDYDLVDPGVISLEGDPPSIISGDNLEHGGSWGDSGYRQYHSFDDGYPLFIPDYDIISSSDPARIEEYDNMQRNLESGNPDLSYTSTYEGSYYKLDSFMVCHLRITIAEEECNGPLSYDVNYSQPTGVYYNEDFTPSDNPTLNPAAPPYHEYQDINEAGLFVAPTFTNLTGNPVNAANNPEIFARVTFPTIRKRDDRELVFNWYLYF